MRKPFIFLASAVALISTGAASAETMSDLEYLQLARCRGLAVSDGLGKVDSTSIDKLLMDQTAKRELPVRNSAAKKIKAATAQANGASGSDKAKLLAERAGVCAQYIGAAAQVAAN